MKKSYRFIAVLSSLIICVAAFSACGDNNENNNSNDSSIIHHIRKIMRIAVNSER